MRIGMAWVACANAHYRAIDPVKAMARRGHEIVAPPDGNGDPDPRRLAGCDVVHVYRRCEEETRRLLSELTSSGTPITYDNDDDFTALPKEAATYRDLGGLEGQRGFSRSMKVARLARVFTTTNQLLADKYRRAGVERVEAIGNYLAPDVARPRVRHDGVVIGWIAGGEHQVDAAKLKLADTLRRVLERHPEARVECIGVNLALPERYRHDQSLDFAALPERTGGFDVGIAPLVDIPLNQARSDIKVKEYAASGVPWLASPVGPYAELGERQGGRLVPDDGWFEALDRLVADRRERRQLARNAQAWAREQTIEAVADRWEAVFAEAAGVSVPSERSTDRPSRRLRLRRRR